MSATSAVARAMPAPTQPDLTAVKTRQQGAWSSGDYAVVGTTLEIVGETLCEALDLRAGQKVLDVAAGNGNVTLAAARRWCEVVSWIRTSLVDTARVYAMHDAIVRRVIDLRNGRVVGGRYGCARPPGMPHRAIGLPTSPDRGRRCLRPARTAART